jgi:PEP-CTERM motif
LLEPAHTNNRLATPINIYGENTMKKLHLLDAFLLFLVVASGSASASLVEYQIHGTVGVVDTPLQGGAVNVGDVVTGSFSAEANSVNDGPGFIVYSTSDLVLNIGNDYTVTSPEGYIYVFTGVNGRIQIDFTQGLGLAGPAINGSWVPDYFDSQYNVNSNDYSTSSLPSVIDVSQPYIGIDSSNLRFNVDDSAEIKFSLTQISAVPLPATVWLFGSGLLGFIGAARQEKAA